MIDSREFAEWMAFYQVEPFGEERDDMRQAIMPYMFASAFSKKGKKVRYEDFLVSNMLHPKPKEQTAEQMKAVLKMVAAKANKHGKRR